MTTDPIAAAADYWRTRADQHATYVKSLSIALNEALTTVARLEAALDEARADADMWHDEAHRLRAELTRLRALALNDHTPSSLT